jgi:hypothetical protein
MYVQPVSLVAALGLTVMFFAIAFAITREKLQGEGFVFVFLLISLTVIWAPILFPDLWAAYNGN